MWILMELSRAQQKLFDLCHNDLTESVKSFRLSAESRRGQRVLADLRRMQNLAQRHLSLPGEVLMATVNVYVTPRLPSASQSLLQKRAFQMLVLGWCTR